VNGLTADVKRGDSRWRADDNLLFSAPGQVVEQGRFSRSGPTGDKNVVACSFDEIENELLLARKFDPRCCLGHGCLHFCFVRIHRMRRSGADIAYRANSIRYRPSPKRAPRLPHRIAG
jgi:hypothetical protein